MAVSDTARAPAYVKSAARVLAVLDLLAERGPLRLSEIVEALGLPPSSAHGLLHTMVLSGYVERDADQAYGLGLRLWQIAQTFDGIERLRRVMKPFMDELVERTGETVQLAQLDGIESLYLEISLSPHPMKLASTVGGFLAAHASAIGKALLAGLDPEEARARLERSSPQQLTPNTITDVDALMRELAAARRRGYALDVEEALIGLRCIAMPLHVSGEVVAALSVSIPTPRYDKAVAAKARAELADIVAEAERRLGPQPA